MERNSLKIYLALLSCLVLHMSALFQVLYLGFLYKSLPVWCFFCCILKISLVTKQNCISCEDIFPLLSSIG